MQDKKKRLQMEGVLSSFMSTPGFQQDPPKESNPLAPLSVRVPTELLEQLRDLAFWERKSFQNFVQEAFETYVHQVDNDTLHKARKARLGNK